jgi:hypothetical protein
MAAILDFKVKTRSNHQIDIRNEFLDPKNPKKHILYNILGHTNKNKINNMADGSHFEFMAATEFAHTFARGMGAKIVIYPSQKTNPLRNEPSLSTVTEKL